jgi:hypothetical protein
LQFEYVGLAMLASMQHLYSEVALSPTLTELQFFSLCADALVREDLEEHESCLLDKSVAHRVSRRRKTQSQAWVSNDVAHSYLG